MSLFFGENMSKTKNKSDNKTEKALAAEKEQFGKQQVSHFVTVTDNFLMSFPPISVDFKVFLIVHTVCLMITSFNCQMGTRQYRNVKFFTSSDILVENLVKYITCQGNSLVLFLSCLNLEVQSDVAVLTSSSCPDCSSFISFSSTASAKLSPQLKHHQKTNMYAVSF